MASKSQRLQERYAANIAGSLGAGDPSPGPALATAPSGPDRYAGRTKGNGGKMLIGNIVPDPEQPRKEFDQAELEQLVHSLRTHGQLQSIRVRWSQPLGKWIITEGERRWRAAQIAGLTTLDCVFVESEVTADVVLEEQVMANCARSDLKPIERALAFRRLAELKGWSGAQVADRLGLDRTSVTRALQLLELPPAIQDQIAAGKIVPAVGVELAKIDDPAEQLEVAEQVVSQGLNRSEASKAVKSRSQRAPVKKPSKTVTFIAAGCTVTLTFKRVPSDEQILAVLQEVIEQHKRMQAA